MKWKHLLSDQRLGGEVVIVPSVEKNCPRTEFEKDYRRIICSASFRRLQDKTQVFPLEQNDFVRTRLTHSYETAALAKMLGRMILSQYSLKNTDEEDAAALQNIPEILSCAGLLHDIGNPPFGHFGEEVIKDWFRCNLKKITLTAGPPSAPGKDVFAAFEEQPLTELLSPLHQADLFHFDGNAQALRILTRLHIQDSEPGLNLTCAVLNTLVKYPTAANQVGSDGSLLRKKMGYTDEDKETYLAITGHTGARDCRHPLAFVLEAADDIAYKTADLEDSVKKGLLNLDVLLAFIDQELQSYPDKTGKAYRYAVDLFKPLAEQRQKGKELAQTVKHLDPDFYAIQNWLPFAQEWLMYCATYGFRQLHYQEIMAGDYQKDLFVGTNHAYSVTVIDKIMREFVFPNRGIIKLELAADAILSNLLQKFTIAALFHDKVYSSSNYVNIPAYQKLYSLISDNYRAAYKQSLNCFRQRHPADEEAYREYDIYLRLLLVTDYISGMTDSYAKSLYQELNGIYNSKGID